MGLSPKNGENIMIVLPQTFKCSGCKETYDTNGMIEASDMINYTQQDVDLMCQAKHDKMLILCDRCMGLLDAATDTVGVH